MKKQIKFLLVIVACGLFLQAAAKTSPRDVRLFDFDWKFSIGDDPRFKTDSLKGPAFAAIGFNDTSWQNVQLPHDWNIRMPFDRKGKGSAAYLPESVGWYRKTFSFSASELKGKEVKVLFEGVFHKSDVYINGHHLGFHPYGFTSFEYDLTPWLKAGEDNVLAVRVNCKGGRPRWYAGSGIYRHVWLKVLNPVHVDTYGTYVTTPEVNSERATIHIETTIIGNATKVSHTVYSPFGKILAKVQGEKATVKVARPELWSITSPNLYSLVTEVRSGNKITDVSRTRFGIRTVNFDANTGFSINGRRLKLQGMCLHQDDGVLGTALPKRSLERRLQILKEYGCNAIRCSHNQPSVEFLDLCDSLGFIVIDEAFDKWRSGYYGEFFDKWWKRDIADMVLRDRNHPSVVLWSIGNELSEAWRDGNEGYDRARMLQDFVHQLDPSRLCAMACQNNHKEHFASATDVVGYNYLEKRMLSDHKKFPERRFLITEELPYYQGAEGNLRSYDTDNPWNTIAKNDFCAGGFIWPGVDYLGEAGWPAKGWPGGLFDINMNEKPRAAFHRAMWNPAPMVSIAVEHQGFDLAVTRDLWQWPRRLPVWNFDERINGLVMQVYTVTNCEEVELFLNGKKMGRERTADFPNHTIEWNVPYHKGLLLAKAFNGDKEVAQYVVKTTGKTNTLVVTPDRSTIAADGQDLAYITLELQDKDGLRVLTDDRALSVSLEGEGTLMGLQSGDLRRPDSFATPAVRSYFGRAMVIVRSTRKPGTMRVKVRMEGNDKEYIAVIKSI